MKLPLPPPSCAFVPLVKWMVNSLQTAVLENSITILQAVLFLLFIGVQLLYNVVLLSAVQQSESVTHTHMPLWLDVLPTEVTAEYWVEFSVLYGRFSSLSTLCIAVYISQSPSSSHAPLSFLGVHSFVLYIFVSIPALQIGLSVPFFTFLTLLVRTQIGEATMENTMEVP